VQRYKIIWKTKRIFEKKDKINRDLLGRKGNYFYLCSGIAKRLEL
jgi:hypothetical protein